jgi:hypothetical protein
VVLAVEVARGRPRTLDERTTDNWTADDATVPDVRRRARRSSSR